MTNLRLRLSQRTSISDFPHQVKWGLRQNLSQAAGTEGPSHIIPELCTQIHNEQTDRNYYVEDHSDALGNMTSIQGEIPTIMGSIVNTERLEAHHYTTKTR